VGITLKWNGKNWQNWGLRKKALKPTLIRSHHKKIPWKGMEKTGWEFGHQEEGPKSKFKKE